MSAKDELKRSQATLLIDPRELKFEPGFNIRDLTTDVAREKIERLADSMEAGGYLSSHPIEYQKKGDDYFVRAGHRRTLAALEVIKRGNEGFKVPIIPEAKGTSPKDRDINLIISNGGEPLTLKEQGDGFKRLLGHGMTVPEIAKRCGVSATHVNRALEFLTAPTEVHKLVDSGKVSATFAAEVAREAGSGEEAVETLNAAVQKATAAGKTKATKKHVEPKAEKAPKAEAAKPAKADGDQTFACVRLVREIARMDDPRDLDAKETMKTLIKLVNDARSIFEPALADAQ